MSQSAKDTWLSEQLASFEAENKSHYYGEKDVYVENLYKYLKKITKRWAVWNHKSFGDLTSVEQVKELLQWERSRGLRHHSGRSRNRGNNSSSSDQEFESTNPLDKFVKLCECSQKLLNIFKQNIYKPLADFFAGQHAMTALQDILRNLAKCLQGWEALVTCSEIDDHHFSKESEKDIFMNGLRNRTNDFDLVLRLVPDLFEKHLEALRLASRWKLITKASGIKRRETFTLPVPNTAKLLRRREEIQRRSPSRRADSMESPANSSDTESALERQLDNAESRYRRALQELRDAKAACVNYEEELIVYKNGYEEMKLDLNSMKSTCNDLRERISESRANDLSMEEQLSNSSEYSKILKKELDHAKMKYCSQRIKLLNAKKRVESLNTQLTYSYEKYRKLGEDSREMREKCGKLEEQLAISRRNLQTQGGMIDALQHQCKTLYDDLERSNERCNTMEEDLKASKKKCKELHENIKTGRSRELELETENTYLRSMCGSSKGLDQPAKKDCMFPEIIRGKK
eukprot:gene146-758_t